MPQHKLPLTVIKAQSDQSFVPNHLPFWVRGGSVAICVALIILFIIGAFVPFPEKVDIPVTLTNTVLPQTVRVNEKLNNYSSLSQLFKKHGDTVKNGELIAVYNSDANYKDILEAEAYINNLMLGIAPKSTNTIWQLGELEVAYNQVVQSLRSKQFNNQEQFNERNLQYWLSEKQALLAAGKNQLGQINQTNEDEVLAKKMFTRDSLLYVDKVFSKQEFEQAKQQFNRIKLEVGGQNQRKIEIDYQLAQVERQIEESRQKMLKDKFGLHGNAIEAINQYFSNSGKWKKNHEIRAELDGIISFAQPIQINRLLQADQDLLFIKPLKDSIFCFGYAPSLYYGKLKTQQKVRIKLEAYPYQEFGTVKGYVSSLSGIATKGNYYIIISIDNLQNKKIQFTANMQGSAAIIVNNSSILKRIFKQVYYFFE